MHVLLLLLLQVVNALMDRHVPADAGLWVARDHVVVIGLWFESAVSHLLDFCRPFYFLPLLPLLLGLLVESFLYWQSVLGVGRTRPGRLRHGRHLALSSEALVARNCEGIGDGGSEGAVFLDLSELLHIFQLIPLLLSLSLWFYEAFLSLILGSFAFRFIVADFWLEAAFLFEVVHCVLNNLPSFFGL